MDKKVLISQNDLFRDMGKDYLDELVELSEIVEFDPRDTICREGGKASHFYLIEKGRAAVELYGGHRGAMTIQTLEVGSVIGWSWMIPPYEWTFDVRAQSAVTALSFPGEEIRAKSEKDHEFGYYLHRAFARILAQRLEGTRIQLLNVYR